MFSFFCVCVCVVCVCLCVCVCVCVCVVCVCVCVWTGIPLLGTLGFQKGSRGIPRNSKKGAKKVPGNVQENCFIFGSKNGNLGSYKISNFYRNVFVFFFINTFATLVILRVDSSLRGLSS